MSLIEEALRRVQHVGSPSKGQPPPAPPPSPEQNVEEENSLQAPVPTSHLWNRFAIRWVGLGMAAVGVVGVALWTYRVMVTLTPAVVAVPTKPSTPPPALQNPTSQDVGVVPHVLASRPPPPPSEPLAPNLQLNGVVQGVGEPFAIINGVIVRLGETVEGATLFEVGENSAKLRWSNKEVELRTNR